MAQLDPEDFGRLQNQLLELREKNYSLEDALRKSKKDSEIRLRTLEEENTRYLKVIQASKKQSEVELLMRDNSYLRNKLRDQEEDFRLQNNTLLQELSRLVGENERYERQVKLLCGDQSKEDACDGDLGSTDDSKEVLRLRVELTEMEKKLHESERRMEAESCNMKEKIAGLNVQISQLRNILKMHSIPIDEGEISLGQGEGVSFKKLSLQDDDGLESDLERPSETLHQYQERTSQLQCEVERIQCQLREEKERNTNLTSDKIKLEEELKIVNERLVETKEKAQQSSDLENAQQQEAALKVQEIESLLRNEIKQKQKVLQETQSNLAEANSKLMTKSTECESLIQKLESLKQDHEAAESKFNENKAVLQEKDNIIEDLEEKVSVVTSENTKALEQKVLLEKKQHELEEDLDKLRQELESKQAMLAEQTKLSESRKSLMEEMKSHMEEERNNQRLELEQLSDKHELELTSISTENQQLKDQMQEVSTKMSGLEEKVKAFDEERSRLQEMVNKLSADLETARKLTEEEKDRITAEKIQEIEDLTQKFEEDKRDLQTQLEISNIQRQEAEEAVEALNRKVADGEEEQRIHERKGMTLLKDLKKQLAVERKRADRLQEKLSQLLTDPAQLTAITTLSDAGDDVSSVSSWSMVSGEPREPSTRENSIIVSPQGSPPPGTVTEETASLVNRVTDLQQQKWQLEERITHLESSSAAMAEDILKKSAVIQHYCMDKTSESSSSTPTSPLPPALGEKLNVRRMLELIRGGAGEESLKEINRRLQALLEETLSKNMQLHQDVENLSQQVHELSKLAAQKTDT